MSKTKHSILIFLVDDDPIFLMVMETQFKEQTNYQIRTFSTGEECLKNLSQKPNIVFLDYNLNTANPKAMNGLKVLEKIKAADYGIQVIMLSSQESIAVAINCMKHHAFDYIIKSEAAFIRAQHAISRHFDQNKLKKTVKTYKTSTITLSLWVLGMIVSAIVSEIFFPYLFK